MKTLTPIRRTVKSLIDDGYSLYVSIPTFKLQSTLTDDVWVKVTATQLSHTVTRANREDEVYAHLERGRNGKKTALITHIPYFTTSGQAIDSTKNK